MRPPISTLQDKQFLDTDSYISGLKDAAMARVSCKAYHLYRYHHLFWHIHTNTTPPSSLLQESTILSTVHCPENRYLLASSNQGRLAVWDLSHYLFPSKAATSWTTASSSQSSQAWRLNNFRKALQCNEVRVYPAELLRKGYPRLSLHVSDR